MGALDFNLGSNSSNGATSLALTTSHLASSGTRVVVLISYFAAAGTTSLSGGGLTWHQDKHVANGSDQFDIWSAPAVAGLASSTVLTVTISAGAFGGCLLGAASISGVDMTQGGGIDNTGSGTTTGTNWSSGAASAVAGGISIGGAGFEAAATTTGCSASTGTLVHGNAALDYNAAAGQGFCSAFLVVAGGAAGAVSGAVGTTTTATTEALVIYKGTAGAAAASPFATPNLPFMAPQGGIL